MINLTLVDVFGGLDIVVDWGNLEGFLRRYELSMVRGDRWVSLYPKLWGLWMRRAMGGGREGGVEEQQLYRSEDGLGQ